MGLFSSIGNFFGDVLKPVTSVVGGVLGLGETHSNNQAKEDIARQQIQFQQDYAKNRLQWQVEDAKKAGLHPMVAAGLSPSSYSPVSFQSEPLNFDFVKDLGQNVDYAATKAKTREQQEEAFDFMKRSNENTLRGQELDNELKQLEIMSMVSRLAETGPAAPPSGKSGAVIDGQGDSFSPFMDKPIVRDGWLLDEQGRKIAIIPSEDLASRTEDKFIIEWLPWGGSGIRSARAKYLGQEVAGHWWHGDDKGFLPYPPKNTDLKGKGSFYENARNAMRFYRDYDAYD